MAQPTVKEVATDTETEFPGILEQDQIAALAYALWQAIGCPEGSPEDDWLQAEQELIASR
jgi:Protein of unknown function (DUF2934)